MTAALTLIDTDILSAIMREKVPAVERARRYLMDHRRFSFSILTRYEIMRGLLAKKASKQLSAFERMCAASHVLPLTDEVIVQAASIYADLHRRGELISDADIFIAATAIHHGLTVATNNEDHFRRIPNLIIDNWLTSQPGTAPSPSKT